MSDDDKRAKMIAGPVHAETFRIMAMIWEAWRTDIDAEVATDEASSVPLLTKPARWTLPRIDGDDEMRLQPCAWRRARGWCRCFRCDALSAIEMNAREILAGRRPLALAPDHTAVAAALAASAPKWLGKGARKVAQKAKAPAPPKAIAAVTYIQSAYPVADLPLFARAVARRP